MIDCRALGKPLARAAVFALLWSILPVEEVAETEGEVETANRGEQQTLFG